MIRNSIKIIGGTIFAVLSLQIFAENTIRITVKTEERTAAGIGYSVEGKIAGSIGKSYTGKGLKNKKYLFGYRKISISGTNISCGTKTLTKDTTITLVTQGDKCQSVINE